jgi:hypothetical protein
MFPDPFYRVIFEGQPRENHGKVGRSKIPEGSTGGPVSQEIVHRVSIVPKLNFVTED